MNHNQQKNQWNLVAPCGLYCRECTGFLDKKCGGCRSNQGLSKTYRKYCKIYDCLSNENLKICLDCHKFPCRYFDFFKDGKLEKSPWFIDISTNMKQIRKKGITNFLEEKANWIKKRKKCAKKKGIKYCDECKQWPCRLLTRPILVPADLKEFKKFMKNK